MTRSKEVGVWREYFKKLYGFLSLWGKRQTGHWRLIRALKGLWEREREREEGKCFWKSFKETERKRSNLYALIWSDLIWSVDLIWVRKQCKRWKGLQEYRAARKWSVLRRLSGVVDQPTLTHSVTLFQSLSHHSLNSPLCLVQPPLLTCLLSPLCLCLFFPCMRSPQPKF